MIHSIAFLEQGECVEKLGMMKNGHIFIFVSPHESNAEKCTFFSHQNKGFINYDFCRNWAVRNPTGTPAGTPVITKKVDPTLTGEGINTKTKG